MHHDDPYGALSSLSKPTPSILEELVQPTKLQLQQQEMQEREAKGQGGTYSIHINNGEAILIDQLCEGTELNTRGKYCRQALIHCLNKRIVFDKPQVSLAKGGVVEERTRALMGLLKISEQEAQKLLNKQSQP
jgi:hypothetical protein